MSENLAGKTVKEHFYLEKKLDSGGFGAIYVARDTFSAIGGNYIVKHFAPNYSNQAQWETAMRLFRQESDSLQELGNHPQIPRIYDFFEEDSNFFLVQELIEGQTLEQELARVKYLSQAKVIELLTQTLEVLRFVHDSGYIHRDIKPANLIRNRFDRRIFLIDFGAVKEKIDPKNIGDRGEFSFTVGILSPGYTPDEQLHGRPEFCSDLYALGMTIIQAMTGKHPRHLARDNNYQLMWRDFLPSTASYEPNFLDIVDKMVEQKWQKRYKSARSILQDLEQTIVAMNTNIFAAASTLTSEPAVSADKLALSSSVDLTEDNSKSRFSQWLLSGLGLTAAIAIPLWLYISNSSQKNYVTYENEYIKLDYPQDWSRDNTNNFLNKAIVFTSPKENESDQFQERVAVIIEESSTPISLKQYSKRAVAQIENLGNFIISHPQPTTLGRSDAQYAVYKGMDRDKQVKRKEVWTVNYRQIYTVIYTAEPEKFNKFAVEANKMIESLEITK